MTKEPTPASEATDDQDRDGRPEDQLSFIEDSADPGVPKKQGGAAPPPETIEYPPSLPYRPRSEAEIPSTPLTVVRRVRINPEALSRLAVLAQVFAMEEGRTESERHHVDLLVYFDRVVLALDLDEEHGTAMDGDPGRPMRVRMALPIRQDLSLDTLHSKASAIGCRVRIHDLIRALRNRVENSHQFGVLDVERDTILDVHAASGTRGRSEPERLVIHPDAGMQEREVEVLSSVPVSRQDSLYINLADAGIQGLEAESLVEMAGATEEEVGLLVNPREPAYIVGAGENALVAQRIEGLAEDEVPEGKDQYLDGPAVLSPRFATAAGLLQSSMEDCLKSRQRWITREHTAKIQTAALAVAGERAPHRLWAEALMAIGQRDGSRSMKEVGKASGNEALARFVRSLSQHAPEDASQRSALASRLREQFDLNAGPGWNLAQADVAVEDLDQEDELKVALAALYRKFQDEPDALKEAASCVAGLSRMQSTSDELKGQWGVDSPASENRGDDVIDVLAAVQQMGREAPKVTSRIVRSLEGDDWEFWRSHFVGKLEELGVDAEVIDHYRSAMDTLEQADLTPEHFKVPSRIRDQWLRSCREQVEGRFWVHPEVRSSSRDVSEQEGGAYRSYVGLGEDSPDVGMVMISDVPRRSDPAHYPWSHEEIVRMFDEGVPVQWEGRLWSQDVEEVSSRVSSLRAHGADLSTPHPVFVARWIPSRDTEDAVIDEGTYPLYSIDEIEVGEDEHSVRYERADRPGGAERGEHGYLRVYGFEINGEGTVVDVPLAQPPALGEGLEGMDDEEVHESGIAMAVSGEEILNTLQFAADRSTQTQLVFHDGAVEARDPDGKRLVLMPKVDGQGLDPRLAPLVEAAGVEGDERGQDVALSEVWAQVEARRRSRHLRESRQGTSRSRARGGDSGSALPHIIWEPSPSSAKREPRGRKSAATLRAQIEAGLEGCGTVREQMEYLRAKRVELKYRIVSAAYKAFPNMGDMPESRLEELGQTSLLPDEEMELEEHLDVDRVRRGVFKKLYDELGSWLHEISTKQERYQELFRHAVRNVPADEESDQGEDLDRNLTDLDSEQDGGLPSRLDSERQGRSIGVNRR